MLLCRLLHIVDAVIDDARGEQDTARCQMLIQLVKQTDDDIRDDVRRDQLGRRHSATYSEKIALQSDDVRDVVLFDVFLGDGDRNGVVVHGDHLARSEFRRRNRENARAAAHVIDAHPGADNVLKPAQTHRCRRMCPRSECRPGVEINDDLIPRRRILLPCWAYDDATPDLLGVDIRLPRLCPILIRDKDMGNCPCSDRSIGTTQPLNALREGEETALEPLILRQIGAHRHSFRVLGTRQIGIVPQPCINVRIHERRIIDLRPRSAQFHQNIPDQICALMRRHNTHLCPAHTIAPCRHSSASLMR